MISPKCHINYDDGCPNTGSFIFEEETHTMGNALRQTILANPNVHFCGYSVPHPAERKMALRVQAHEDYQIVDIVTEALDNFASGCENMENLFDIAIKNQL